MLDATQPAWESTTHQNDKHDQEEGSRQDCREEDAVSIKVVLRGEALPVGSRQAIEPLSKVHQGCCVIGWEGGRRGEKSWASGPEPAFDCMQQQGVSLTDLVR